MFPWVFGQTEVSLTDRRSPVDVRVWGAGIENDEAAGLGFGYLLP
jgi:hypothetical protein